MPGVVFVFEVPAEELKDDDGNGDDDVVVADDDDDDIDGIDGTDGDDSTGGWAISDVSFAGAGLVPG